MPVMKMSHFVMDTLKMWMPSSKLLTVVIGDPAKAYFLASDCSLYQRSMVRRIERWQRRHSSWIRCYLHYLYGT